jgi:predicted phosphoadenosine phosphosulfate sulfurtransferase
MSKQNLLVSFSGGKTSGMMCGLLLERFSADYEIKFVFANTGQEREETLIFVDQCDKHFELDLAWIEAVVNPIQGKGIRHKIVSFKTASRNGEPFEQSIKKYGIPNKASPICTGRLKVEPMESYERSIGWWKICKKAIGIRADEPKRIGNNPQFIYPMAEWMLDKIDVNNYWERMPFNLQLLPHQGNCSWCWKKSNKKQIMLINESPALYDFPRRMEKKYGHVKADKDNRVFFRENRSTDMLFELAKIASNTNRQRSIFDDDEDSGCSESCEIDLHIEL